MSSGRSGGIGGKAFWVSGGQSSFEASGGRPPHGHGRLRASSTSHQGLLQLLQRAHGFSEDAAVVVSDAAADAAAAAESAAAGGIARPSSRARNS